MAMMDNCKKAEIFDDSGNLLCEAAVSCGPMGGLLLDVPAELDYKAQSLFRVLFYDPTMGMVMCRCTLSSPLDLPEGRRSLRYDIAEQISQENRRQDVKVSLGAEVMIHVSRQPGDKVQVPPEGVSAKVFNISAGPEGGPPAVVRLQGGRGHHPPGGGDPAGGGRHHLGAEAPVRLRLPLRGPAHTVRVPAAQLRVPGGDAHPEEGLTVLYAQLHNTGRREGRERCSRPSFCAEIPIKRQNAGQRSCPLRQQDQPRRR